MSKVNIPKICEELRELGVPEDAIAPVMEWYEKHKEDK